MNTQNERFFQECYRGYCNGRIEQDPSVNWYKGEIGFFDFYIIPLAKKLKDCGVFGVSSDEYLNYAEENRRLWNLRGESIVENYKIKYSNMRQLKEEDHEEEKDAVVAAEPPAILRRTSKVVITKDRGGRAQQASF